MPRYITVPFTTDPEDLIDEAVAYLQDKIPDWEPADGNLDYWIVQAVSSEAAEVADVASAVPEAIFRVFGSDLMGLPPIEESNAFTFTTWTMRDNRGYTVPDGTQVAIRTAGDQALAFVTEGDVIVPPGSTVTAAGAVMITAVEAGLAGSGLGAVGATVELLDPLSYVSTITMTQATSGGVDAEADDVYLDRLVAKLRTMTPRPILPRDFSTLARDVAGVYRAVTIDGYNPANSSSNNERMVTVAAIDSAGANISGTTKAALAAYLDSLREINFIVNAMDPVRTNIAVTYSINVLAGFDSTIVIADATAAVRSFLSPLTWGTEPAVDPNPVEWTDTPIVRYNEMVSVIDHVEGVRYVAALTLNGTTANVTLTGPASLPNLTTITGTAV